MKKLWIVWRYFQEGWEVIHIPARHAVRLAICALVLLTLLRFDVSPPGNLSSSLDRMLAGRQFDFAGWWLHAFSGKVLDELTVWPNGMTDAQQITFVQTFVRDIGELHRLDSEIERIYVDPGVLDKPTATTDLRWQRTSLRTSLDARQNIAETILQEQVESVLREEGFAVGGQVWPPLRFRFTELPDLVVLSRRDKIERIASRELRNGLTIDQQVEIEQEVDAQFDVSSLVTEIGGLGAYPTMLEETSALNWVLGVIAHEWTHNYFLFVFAPIGLNYLEDGRARTMNETAANIVEREIGRRVIERYYPDLRAATPKPLLSLASATFDFRKEMRETRQRTDDLLAEGRIEEAEAYMEQRRQLFVVNGYIIRKLNQAYFAFHGAYNAEPGGAPAAGRDPVGPAVQLLRQRSATLGDFVRTMAAVRDFEDLQERLR